MDTERNFELPPDLPEDLEAVLGEICQVDIEAPGVYLVAISHELPLFGEEYYIVTASSPVISGQVKAYGNQIPGFPHLLSYPIEQEDNGYGLVDYEVERYRARHHLPSADGSSLHEAAVFCMEHHPEYFGTYPVPAVTPMGYTLRHKALDNGIYWIETDQFQQVLAVCYPIWNTEFSDYALELSRQTEFDSAQGIHNTLGYRFFSAQDSCVPVYEILATRPGWDASAGIDRKALMNAIWSYHPTFAIKENWAEQKCSDHIAHQRPHCSKRDSSEKVVVFSPEHGVEFFRF